MKNNEFLSLGALLFYVLVAFVALTFWTLINTLRNTRHSSVAAGLETPAQTEPIPGKKISGERSELLLREQIGFSYLPGNPLAHGWNKANYSIAMDPNPKFLPLRVGSEMRLDMRVESVFAMDHEIATGAQLAERVVYSAIYHKNTMFMLGFRLRKDGKTFENRWVKIEHGKYREPNINEGWPNEYVVWEEGEPEEGGWTRFDLSIPALLQQTWQKQGFESEAMAKVRVRGSVRLSAIKLYAHKPARYQAFQISRNGESPYKEACDVTPEEARGWERVLNEWRTSEEVNNGIRFEVRRISPFGS